MILSNGRTHWSELDHKLDLNLSKEMVHAVVSILKTGYGTLPEATSVSQQLMFYGCGLLPFTSTELE